MKLQTFTTQTFTLYKLESLVLGGAAIILV